jgi:hypothetical protein
MRQSDIEVSACIEDTSPAIPALGPRAEATSPCWRANGLLRFFSFALELLKKTLGQLACLERAPLL